MGDIDDLASKIKQVLNDEERTKRLVENSYNAVSYTHLDVYKRQCIRYVGATPVFCDIKSAEHINIDPIDIERKINSKTKGIIGQNRWKRRCLSYQA